MGNALNYWLIAMNVATCADNAQIVAVLNFSESPFTSSRETRKIAYASSRKLPLFTDQSQRNSQLVYGKSVASSISILKKIPQFRAEMKVQKNTVFVWSPLIYWALAVKVIPYAANVLRVPDLNFRENPSISKKDTGANVQWCNVHCP